MGTKAAPFMFGPPFVVGVALLLAFIFRDSKKSEGPHRLLGLGRARLAKGYLGTLGVLLVLCVWVAYLDRQPSLILYYFVIFSVLLMCLLTAVVLPMLALLRRVGLASLLGVSGGGVVLAIVLGLLMNGRALPSALVGVALAVAFSMAAGLPLTRSSRHVA